MKPTRPTSQSDVAALQMENELLTYEIRHLRARVAAADRVQGEQRRRMERRQQATQEKLAKVRRRVRRVQAEAARARGPRGRDAVADMRWLLSRLDGFPFRLALRRSPEFRELVRAYLEGGGRR